MMTAETELDKNTRNKMQDIFVDLLNSLSAVKEISELDCQASSEHQLIKQALSALIHNQDMERCSFFRLNDHNILVNVTGLSYCEAVEDEEYTDHAQQFKVGEGIIGLAAATKTLQHCHNSLEDDRIIHIARKQKTQIPGSIISVPVFAANLELVGVLNISHPEPYYFTNWHVRLLEIFKNILGQLISNYRLFRNMEQQVTIRTTKLENAFQDIQCLKEHYKDLSMQDQLTQLYNRRYFYNQAEQILASYHRYGQNMCLLIMDIDFFKHVNDRFGHMFGDQVLVDVSQVLKQQVRTSDVLARFGGEEFVIIFSNTSCSNGKIFSERIRDEISQLAWHKDNKKVSITMSIGLYCLDQDCCGKNLNPNIDEIIHYADTALYEAKDQGRDQVVLFCDRLLEKWQSRTLNIL